MRKVFRNATITAPPLKVRSIYTVYIVRRKYFQQ